MQKLVDLDKLLYMAVFNEKSTEIVQYLIDEGANVNYYNGVTSMNILTVAIIEDQLKILKVLLENNCNLDFTESDLEYAYRHRLRNSKAYAYYLKYLKDMEIKIDYNEKSLLNRIIKIYKESHDHIKNKSKHKEIERLKMKINGENPNHE